MFCYANRNTLTLFRAIFAFLFFKAFVLSAQPNCEINPASNLSVKFFCDSLLRGNATPYAYQRMNQQGALAYHISIQHPTLNIFSSDSVLAYLQHQFTQPWNDWVFTPKTSSSNFLPSNRLFKFHIKGVADRNEASYIREMVYVKTLKNALLLDFIYASGSSYRSWNDAILQSIQ